MGGNEVADRARRVRSYGNGMKRGAVLTVLAVAAYKLGRRDGRWIWERRAGRS